MLRREIIAVCSHIHTKHINTVCVCVCGQKIRSFNAVAGGEGGDRGGALTGVTGAAQITGIDGSSNVQMRRRKRNCRLAMRGSD